MKNAEEERNLHLDKPAKGKTQEQLKKHTLDESMENKPIDRAIHLLTVGDDMQKISVIQNLPDLIICDSSGTYNRVIPKIKQDLPGASCEFQIAASAVFRTLLEKSGNVAILQSIIAGIESPDPNVAYAWCDALFNSIRSIPELLIQNNLIPLVKQKYKQNSPVPVKIFAAKLIGQICADAKFRTIDVKKDLLPIVTSLCQDLHPDVRATICHMLPRVANVLGAEVPKTNLLSCIVELAQDDNMNVRATSITAISVLLKVVSQEVSKNTLMPLIKKICQIATEESLLTALILSSEYSDLMLGCQSFLNDQDIVYFIRVYKQLSLKGKTGVTTKVTAAKEVTIRQKCAANIFGIMKIAYDAQVSYMQDAYACFRDHVIDPCYLVRQAAASVLPNIAILLGKDNKIVKNEMVRLLRDDAFEVLEIIIPAIFPVFSAFVNSETLSYNEANQASTELCKALIKCQTELGKGYNWRMMVEYLRQLEVLPTCIPSDYIHSNFTPGVFEMVVYGKAQPVRQQAIRTLVVFMRYNFKANQTKWIKDSLIRQTAFSRDCRNRILYINVCEAVLSIYSEKFFKESFLQPLLQLSRDKVISVRVKFMQFSTRLKSMVTLASDAAAKHAITEAISKLESSEKSKCILDIIRIKRKELPPKYTPEALKEEECRVKEEGTTDIKMVGCPGQQKPQTVAYSGDTRRVSVSRPSDMHFLQQHFYIDAGIKLDVLDLDNKPEVASKSTNLKSSNICDIETTNITDDVKVNLRNLNSKVTTASKHDNKSKRHSSIISAKYFGNSNFAKPTFNRRRSLYCNSSIESKIPIPNRTKIPTSCEIVSVRNLTDCVSDGKPKNMQKISGLPVYNSTPSIKSTLSVTSSVSKASNPAPVPSSIKSSVVLPSASAASTRPVANKNTAAPGARSTRRAA